VESPEILSWDQIKARLNQIMYASPPQHILNLLENRDNPCVRGVIRLRDIANWCDFDRQCVYRARRGDRLLKPEVQRQLSWFFYLLDRGRLSKEKCYDGRWRIVTTQPQVPTHAADAGAPTRKATVDFRTGRLTLGAVARVDGEVPD